MAEVTLKDVRKVYAGGVEAVKGVSFDVPDGHFCVMVGPSGCGKSTLLRMIAGVETITSGEVRIGERAVNGGEAAGIGFFHVGEFDVSHSRRSQVQ